MGEFEDHDYVIAMEQVRQSDAEDERENILAHFMEKAYSTEMEAYLAEAEYSYIQEADKRAFYMAIELWKKEAGPGRQGHKDFIAMASKMIPQLGLAKDYRAYLVHGVRNHFKLCKRPVFCIFVGVFFGNRKFGTLICTVVG